MAGFAHRACQGRARIAHHRYVVGAVDGDCHELRLAVCGGHHEAIGVDRAFSKRVVRSVGDEGPDAGRVNAEEPQAIAAGHVGLRDETHGTLVGGKHATGLNCQVGFDGGGNEGALDDSENRGCVILSPGCSQAPGAGGCDICQGRDPLHQRGRGPASQ